MSAAVFSERFAVAAGDFIASGDASSRIKMLLKHLGVDSALARRVAIAAYEGEMNLCIHSYGGEITLEMTPDALHLTCRDSGPGIPDVSEAMREGFSTAPESIRQIGFGAGMGLPNMKRCADGFEIVSQMGKGTRVRMRFDLSPKE